jgi:hypothetical protein
VPADLVPSWIGAVATAVGVAVALIAILLTYKQVRLTAQQMRETSLREAQNSEDQTRPYLGIDVVPGLAGPPSFDLVVANFGKTTAHDIRLALVGREFQAQSEADEIGPALGRLFAAGFDLAPGARRRVFWRMPDEEGSSPRGDMGAPVSAEIVVTYQWVPGGDREIRRYEERLRYDLTEYPKLTPLPCEGAKADGSESDPTTSFKNTAHALRAIAQHVGEIRR